MISVKQALDILSKHKIDFGSEEIPLSKSIGRFLKSDITADRNLPPYDRVTMDGIAILFSSFDSGQKTFEIENIGPAGSPQKELKDSKKCIEIMTGAVLPKGTDTVIRYEDLEIANGQAKIIIDQIRHRQNIHFEGLDKKAGEVVVPKDTIIGASGIGIAASVGQENVTVAKLPSIMLISTGDELVEIDQRPLPHQIRKSNIYRLTAALENLQIEVAKDHLVDDAAEIKSKIESYLNEYDVIMLSGGVSKGKFDFIPQVMEALGVEKLFHKINQKPGKPFWFGSYNQGACTVFALPGNPVSSFLCMQKYFRHWLMACVSGKVPRKKHAVLSEAVEYKPALTLFQEVRLEVVEDATLIAHPLRGNGSGDMSNLVAADGFIILPPDQSVFKQGDIYEVLEV